MLILSLTSLTSCNGSGGLGTRTAMSIVGGCTITDVSQQTCPSAAANVIPLQVGGTLSSSYINEPVVSVKICMPGSTTQCQTIDNVLLDTGSYGLRVFQSLVSLSLPQVKDIDGTSDLAECVIFGTGSTWGPIKSANVIIGGESAATMSIQMIDQTYYNSNIPKGNTQNTIPDCVTYADISPTPTGATKGSGYNGILGVGLSVNDGGFGYYYKCATSGGTSTCLTTAATAASKVKNPVAALSQDNNGLSIVLPPLPTNGAGVVTGCMVLGINTQTNNIPASTQIFSADSTNNEFQTTWNSITYPAFIDSGSNAYYFPATTTALGAACTTDIYGTDISGFMCPATTQCLTAKQIDTLGSPTNDVQLAVANGEALFESSNFNYSDLGGAVPTDDPNNPPYFDWGLPFFFGRTVYVGFTGRSANVKGVSQTGPFWAY